MTKHETILRLIDQLRLDDRGWVVTGNWSEELCAVGIACPDQRHHLVYVSTFGLPEARFDYECETPFGEKPEEYTVTDKGEAVDFDTLLEAMERHLLATP